MNAAKRAQWEAFEFRVPCEGVARVENVSYGAESDEHVSVVNVEDFAATGCSCKGYEFNEGACKHMLAVEDALPVLLAASGFDFDDCAASSEESSGTEVAG